MPMRSLLLLALPIVVQCFREETIITDSQSSNTTTSHEWSALRRQCIAKNLMDRKVFPPETFPNWAVRMVIPNIPYTGDVFIKLGQLHLLNVDIPITMTRDGQDSFLFKASGTIRAYAEDVAIQAPNPSSGFDPVVFLKGLGAIERNTIGLVFGGSDYGRLDILDLTFTFNLESQVKLGKDDNWEIIDNDKAKTSANIDFHSGGSMSAIIEKILNAFGGIDKVLLNQFWPHLVRLVPPVVAEAFQTVTLEDGTLEIGATISGVCKHGRAKLVGNRPVHMCVDDVLDVELDIKVESALHPQSVIEYLASGTGAGWGNYAGLAPSVMPLLTNLAKSYHEKKSVFYGYLADAAANIDITPDHKLSINYEPNLRVPTDLLQVLAPNLDLSDYYPTDGESTKITVGHADVVGPAVSLRDVEVENFKLKIGEATEIKFEGTIEAMNCEIMDDEHPIDNLAMKVGNVVVLSPDATVEAHIENVVTSFNRYGFDFGLNAESFTKGVKADIDAAVVDVGLGGMREMMMHGNMRKGDATDGGFFQPDGALPANLWDKPARLPSPLDLNTLIQEFHGRVVAHVSVGSPSTSTDESTGEEMIFFDAVDERGTTKDLDLTFKLLMPKAKAALKLDAAFFKSILDAGDPDFGYVAYQMTGRWSSWKTSDSALAFIEMHCGHLRVYDDLIGEKAYSHYPEVKLDLYEVMLEDKPCRNLANDPASKCWLLEQLTMAGLEKKQRFFADMAKGAGKAPSWIDHVCVKLNNGKYTLTTSPYFCMKCKVEGKAMTTTGCSKLEELHDIVKMQLTRFSAGYQRKVGDNTWFYEKPIWWKPETGWPMYPPRFFEKEVQSPIAAWNKAGTDKPFVFEQLQGARNSDRRSVFDE